MTQLVWSVGAFIVVVGLLVTVHEFGHFYVARRCGVRVLRFSVGFGRPLLRRMGRDGTEYVLAAVPLGGYVRMLDEADGPVPQDQAAHAFNRKPVAARMAVVAAGPAANLLLAVLAYWLMFMLGTSGLRAELGEVPAPSAAARAGFMAGDVIRAVDGKSVQTWEEASLALLDAALAGDPVSVTVQRPGREDTVGLTLDPGQGAAAQAGNPLTAMGLAPSFPVAPAVVGEVLAGSAAERAGFAPGDTVMTVDGVALAHWQQWVDTVRAHPGQALAVVVERDGTRVALEVVPDVAVESDGRSVGRVGTTLRPPPPDPQRRVLRRFGPIEALGAALGRTRDVSALTLHMLYRMVRGQAAVENLSGPITIAQFAGESARIGPSQFLSFLALVSVSLGLLNLLPIPVLDGGHLVYHAIELVRGSPPSERIRIAGQQGGMVLLIGLTFLAIYNDLSRLFS